MSPNLETRVQEIGRELFERVQGDRPPFLGSDRWGAALFRWAIGMETAKLQLLRFVDVLPALAADRDVVGHLREYFEGRPIPFAALMRVALGLSRAGWLGEKIVAVGLRETVRHLARRFIAGTTPDEAIGAARAARRAGQTFTIDVLGEACLSDDEAFGYQRRYLELVERLGGEAPTWSSVPALDRAPWGPLPRVNVSVKLSALHPWLDPIDPVTSSGVVRQRLRPILRAAARHGAHIHIDMEERRLKDLTLGIFTELAAEPEFRASRNLGIVLQAYLTDTVDDAQRLIAWARRRGTPVTVRLVKGAYWDYDTARARLEGWPVPVFERKPETDAAFERLTRVLLEASDAVDLAVGSHNIRSVAHALALRQALGLPQGQVEFQALYGMATPLVRALTERGERVRVYMPFGELIPGMAYLVRRLLENTSNESFLRRGFAENEPVAVLLADPAVAVPAMAVPAIADEPRSARASAGPERDSSRASAIAAPGGRSEAPAGRSDAPAGFVNEANADFSCDAARRRFAAALADVRGELGQHYPLVIGGDRVDSAARLTSVNPSRPHEIVGTTGSASVDDVERAVAAAERAFPAWRDLGVAGRAELPGDPAQALGARRFELAAWIASLTSASASRHGFPAS